MVNDRYRHRARGNCIVRTVANQIQLVSRLSVVSLSIMASKQDNPFLVAGIQLTQKRDVKGGDGFSSPLDTPVEKEMQIDFKKPLQDAVKNVFDHCGKVVLAFPYSSQAQVSGSLR